MAAMLTALGLNICFGAVGGLKFIMDDSYRRFMR
jgi:hypothetical protein